MGALRLLRRRSDTRRLPSGGARGGRLQGGTAVPSRLGAGAAPAGRLWQDGPHEGHTRQQPVGRHSLGEWDGELSDAGAVARTKGGCVAEPLYPSCFLFITKEAVIVVRRACEC